MRQIDNQTLFRKACRFMGVSCLVAGVLGCSAVAPWERGNLAKPQMAMDPTPLQATMRAHNYNSREAALGSHVSGGGGCGCY